MKSGSGRLSFCLAAVICCFLYLAPLYAPDNSMIHGFSVASAAESDRYVISVDGLIMRKSPDTKAAKLATVPFGEKVTVVSQKDDELFMAGQYGRWTEIKWRKSNGWAFGGFLRGYDINALRKQAAAYYRAELSNPAEFNRAIRTQTEKDITVHQVVGDLAHISFLNRWEGFPDKTLKSQSIWRYAGAKWEKVIGGPEPERRIFVEKLLYLNNDRFPDCVTSWLEEGPQGEVSSYMIHLGNAEGDLERVQSVSCDDGIINAKNAAIGRCDGCTIKCSDGCSIYDYKTDKAKKKTGSSVKIIFNCDTNMLEFR